MIIAGVLVLLVALRWLRHRLRRMQNARRKRRAAARS